MAEDKRANPFPYPTAEDVAAAPGDRETKAARNIMVRNIQGIPRAPFLRGDSDHAPILQGVKDLTTACYQVLDAFAEESNAHPSLLALRDLLEDHGCPPAPPPVEDA